MVDFKYHGNYCGPGYTGGRFVSKGDYSVAPSDSLDAQCRKHDYGYEFGDQHAADHELIRDTKLGFNKEGLLNLGFRIKDAFYNNLTMVKPKSRKQTVMMPVTVNKASLGRVAFRRGARAEYAAIKEGFDDSSSSKASGPGWPSNTPLTSTFMGGAVGSSKSLRRTHGKGNDLIEETEYITDLSATSQNFAVINQYALNPAQSTTFPWAASIAKQYEKWVCEYIEFQYKPLVSQYASLGQQGKIIMSFDYDASDSPPSNKQQAEDIQEHVDGLPCEYLRLRLKPRMLMDGRDGKYNRAGPLPGGSDIKSFDGGNLYISTSGLSAGSGSLGELHVRYRFKLLEPILSASSNAAPVNNQVTQLISTTVPAQSGGASAISVWTGSVTNGCGFPTSDYSAGGTTTLHPPAGNYLLTVQYDIENSAGDLTQTYFSILKNGASVYPAAAYNPDWSGPTGVYSFTLTQTWYVSCNGTDTIGVSIGGVYVGGTNTCYNSIVFLAV